MHSLSESTALEVAKELPMQAAIDLLNLQEEVTLQKAISAKILRKVEQKVGRPTLIKLVCAVLKLFCDSMNITQSMNALQVYEAAQLWLDRYPTESLKDLILCLKRAKQGDYGKNFNRFDIGVLGDYWHKYLEQKYEYREQQRQKEKATEGSDEKAVLRSINVHIPEASRLLKKRLSNTPLIDAPTSHEAYVKGLADKIRGASPEQLINLRAEATTAKLADVVSLVEAEMNRRNDDVDDLNKTYETNHPPIFQQDDALRNAD